LVQTTMEMAVVPDAEMEKDVIEVLLDDHNPHKTAVRYAMDGVEKVTTTCFDCLGQNVEYHTFRVLALPLKTTKMSVEVTVYTSKASEPLLLPAFEVENYAPIRTLQHLVRRELMSRHIECGRSAKNITIGCFDSDHDIKVYKPSDACSTLQPQLFATIQSDPAKKLVAVLAIEDGAQRVSGDFIFMEFVRNSTWDRRTLTQRVCRAMTTHIGRSWADAVLIFKNCFAYVDGPKCRMSAGTNVLILLVSHVANVFSRLPPSKAMTAKASEAMNFCVHGFDNDEPLSSLIADLQNRQRRAPHSYQSAYKNAINALQKHDKVQSHKLKRALSVSSRHWPSCHTKTRCELISSLNDSLAEYQREKVLDASSNKLTCAVCQGEPQVFSEVFEIVHAPQVLAFKFERGRSDSKKSRKSGKYGKYGKSGKSKKYAYGMYANDKMEHDVHYPRNGLMINGLAEYDLFGVGVHSSFGTNKSGHYYAHTKSMYNQRWYTVNDSTVSDVCDLKDVHTPAATLLMYSKAGKK